MSLLAVARATADFDVLFFAVSLSMISFALPVAFSLSFPLALSIPFHPFSFTVSFSVLPVTTAS